MPTTASGRAPDVRAISSDSTWRSAAWTVVGERDRADVHAEALDHPAVADEGELRAAAAGVEHGQGGGGEPELMGGGGEGEPRLVLRGQDLDLHLTLLARRVDQLGGVGRDPQPGRADDRDLGRAEPA